MLLTENEIIRSSLKVDTHRLKKEERVFFHNKKYWILCHNENIFSNERRNAIFFQCKKYRPPCSNTFFLIYICNLTIIFLIAIGARLLGKLTGA